MRGGQCSHRHGRSTARSRQLAALKLLRRRLIQAVPLMLGVVVINFC